jgi:hypothetical protein
VYVEGKKQYTQVRPVVDPGVMLHWPYEALVAMLLASGPGDARWDGHDTSSRR